MDKKEVRAVFSKTDRAVYISHLDLMRTIQRAVKRAKLPVWYSEGFNPRIYLCFPLPLALGVYSECEAVDFYVIEDISFEEIKERLNNVLPDGIHINKVYEPVNKNKDIAEAEYIIRMSCSSGNTADAFEDFMSMDKIEVKKRTKKKGEVILDIKPMINILSVTAGDDGSADILCRLPAGVETNVNAAVLADAFIEKCSEKGITAECLYVKRTKIICKDQAEFV